MIDWLINNAFGTWGRGLMDFYITYSLPINIVVVAYGAFLLYLHTRIRPFRRAAIDQTLTIISKGRNLGTGYKLDEFVKGKLDWSAVAAIGEGALIAGRWGLWPIRATPERLQKSLPVSELCRDALAEMQKQAKPLPGKVKE